MKLLVSLVLSATLCTYIASEGVRDQKIEYDIACQPESKFVSVPEQVKGYGESFKQNMLWGDIVVRTNSAGDCKAKAVEKDYPSYYFDKDVAADEVNCFLTHVTVNADYYFPNPDFRTTTAEPKIQQRICKYDGVRVSTLRRVERLQYEKQVVGCSAEPTAENFANVETKIKDAAKKVYTGSCTGADVKLVDTKVNFDHTGSTLTIALTVTSEYTPTGEFQYFLDVNNCADKFNAEDIGDFKISNSKCENFEVQVSKNDLTSSAKQDSRICPEASYIFGPNDYNCYDMNLHPLYKDAMYDAYDGKICDVPDEPLVVLQSLFACKLACGRDASCKGFVYDKTTFACPFLKGDCQNQKDDSNSIYFKIK